MSDLTDRDELKPCPFCGQPFEIKILDDDRAVYRHDNPDCIMHRNDLTGWVYDTPEDMVKALNSRPVEDQLRAERAEAALSDIYILANRANAEPESVGVLVEIMTRVEKYMKGG